MHIQVSNNRSPNRVEWKNRVDGEQDGKKKYTHKHTRTHELCEWNTI